MLRELQNHWRDALVRPTGAPISEDASGLADPRFRIHRGNVLSSLSDTLAAAFPTVARLLGDDNFRVLATDYIAAEPPKLPQLLHYGIGFAAYLETYGLVDELGCLPDVARLDWALVESYHAADAEILGGQRLAAMADRADKLILELHPAARLVTSAYPILDIRTGNGEFEPRAEPQGQAVLVLRQDDTVGCFHIDVAQHCFLSGLASGVPLLAAAENATAINHNFNLQHDIGWHLQAGTFCGCRMINQDPKDG